MLVAMVTTAMAQVLKVSDAPANGEWAENTTWYLIQNKKGGYVSTANAYCNTEGKLVLSNSNAPGDDNENALWCVVGNETDGYKFYNKANGTSKVLLASRELNSANASFYIADATDAEGEYFDIARSQQSGYIVVKDHNNGNNYWNNRGNNLAYWNDSRATDDDGSSFAFLNVAEYTDALSQIQNFLALTGAEYSATQYVTQETADAMMYSNAYCTNTQWGDQFVGWHVLFDNNAGTFFHSEYNSGKTSTDGLDHYLRVDMGDGKTIEEFQFTYTTRQIGVGENHPSHLIVEGSNEENGTYTTIKEYTSGLPNGSAIKFTSETLTCSEPYRYIRFRVVATYLNGKDSGNKSYFYIGEFGMSSPVQFNVAAEYEEYKDLLLQLYLLEESASTTTTAKDRVGILANMNTALTQIDAIKYPNYYALLAKVDELAKYVAAKGTTVGYFNTSDDFVRSYESAEAALENKEDVAAQIVALETLNALELPVTIQPTEDTFYNIVSACSKDHRAGQMIYVNDAGAMHFSRNDAGGLELAKGSLGQVVQFVSAGDGSFYIYFVARDRYLSTSLPNYGGQHSAKVEDVANAKKVTITNMGSENIVKIVSEGGGMLHAQDNESKVVAWDENAINDGSAWRIVEVADPTTASFDLTIGAAGYSTLYLGCDVTIPEGVEAYVVSEIKDTYVNMTAVTGAIPANEAVILKKAEGQPTEATSYSFNYATSANAVEANLLNGTTINTYVAGPAYVLSKPADSEVGLYKAAMNVDATGAATGELTHFLNNANKAYLAVPAEQAQNAASFSFRFDGTTGIENVEGQSEGTVVYDLMGRRVENPTRGIYVINGKKVLVK